MKKIHKLDLILLVGIGLIAIVSALIDFFMSLFFLCALVQVYFIFLILCGLCCSYILRLNIKIKKNKKDPNMSSGLCCFFYRFYILRL